jgi:hypothetical protein
MKIKFPYNVTFFVFWSTWTHTILVVNELQGGGEWKSITISKGWMWSDDNGID